MLFLISVENGDFLLQSKFCHDIIFTNHSTWRFIFIVHECKRFLTLERRTGFMDPPTIYDVSRLSGVSTATVSRTFTTPDRVRESTRRRVYAAAEALHYQPSAIARHQLPASDFHSGGMDPHGPEQADRGCHPGRQCPGRPDFRISAAEHPRGPGKQPGGGLRSALHRGG